MTPLDFQQAQWLLAGAMTIHLLEEAIWLPAWSQRAGRWHPVVGMGEFGFACAVVIGLAWLAAWAAVRGGAGSLGAYAMAGLAVIMLVNIVVPHIGATLELRRYSPGLATSLALNVPAALVALRLALAGGYVSAWPFAVAAGLALLAAAFAWPQLFVLGRWLLRRTQSTRGHDEVPRHL